MCKGILFVICMLKVDKLKKKSQKVKNKFSIFIE